MAGPSDALILNLIQALQVFESIRMQDIRDIRTVDTDMLFVMQNGQRIVWQEGALTVLQKPELILVFKDGTLSAEHLFKQIEMINIHKPEDSEQLLFDTSHYGYHADAQLYQQVICIDQRWEVI